MKNCRLFFSRTPTKIITIQQQQQQLTFVVRLCDVGEVLWVDEVVDPLAGELHLAVAEQLLAALLERDDAEVQFVFWFEHDLLLRHLQQARRPERGADAEKGERFLGFSILAMERFDFSANVKTLKISTVNFISDLSVQWTKVLTKNPDVLSKRHLKRTVKDLSKRWEFSGSKISCKYETCYYIDQ